MRKSQTRNKSDLVKMPVLKPVSDSVMEVDLKAPLVTNIDVNGNGMEMDCDMEDVSTPEPLKWDGFFKGVTTLVQIKVKEQNHLEKVQGVTKNIQSLLNQSEQYSKKIRNFLDARSFLFTTPINEIKIHPQFKKLALSTVVPSTNGFSYTGVKEPPPSTDGLEVVSVVSRVKPNLPPAGEIKRKELLPGTEVWVMKTNSVDVFVEGIIQIVRDADPEKLFKVRFEDTKGCAPRLYRAKQMAYRTVSDVIVPVGTRIVARYADGFKPSMYAGIVAEPPKITNQERYLIFFDDGYAQYIEHRDIYVICSQSVDVADDVHENISDFIRNYLQKYPERPMVKLQKNQITKTEYDRKWWDTKVLDVDASMVKMYFIASQRTEWIYRGSTRLKLLYNELANAEAHRSTGKHRRHNIVPRKPHQPYVEYTREGRDPGDVVTIDSGSDDESKAAKRKNLHARRKTGGSQYLNDAQKSRNTARKSTSMKNRSTSENVVDEESFHTPDIKSHLGYKDLHNLVAFERKELIPHECSKLCLEREPPANFTGKNPFLIPIYIGWERQLRRYKKLGPRTMVMYRSPCGKHMRSLEEIHKYLEVTNAKATIDCFSLDTNLVVFRTFRPREVLYDCTDVTQGRENVPVCCVNSWADEPPPFVEYASKRFPGQGVFLNEDKEFLCGCTCTDNCKDPKRCECQQITNYANHGKGGGESVGYKFRRLKEPLVTGLFECNARCKCTSHCGNRVVQNGLKVRLQMFKTENKGWGIRCLDDLDAGMFICIYAGQLLTEQGADEDGNQFGDEYLAELDHIEVAEKVKEGYESEVFDIENMETVEDDTASAKKEEDEDSKGELPSPNSSDSEVNICDTDSDFESTLRSTAVTTYTTRSRKKSNTKNSDESSGASNKIDDPDSNHSTENKVNTKELPDITTHLDRHSDTFTIIPQPLSPESAAFVEKVKFKRTPLLAENGSDAKSVAKKSLSMKHPVSSPLVPSGKTQVFKSTRSFYGEDSLYIMDAKSKGNIGRYLNHSCTPNVFVQNVFVETHDLRFPEVAFFAQSFIQAGTELTWDYNYEVGSVEDKVLYCYCDSRNCRGRLL